MSRAATSRDPARDGELSRKERRRAVSTQTQTLLLSQGYEPIKVISWRRAITLLTLGKVEVIEAYDNEISAATLVIKIPAVVRLLRAFRRHNKPVRFSRINIFARDGYRCLYCGAKRLISELTYDHVVPRAQGGKTTWDNIATCCVSCNHKKGNRTPAEARMVLRHAPAQPTWTPAVVIRISRHSVPDAWRDYLYWTAEIEPE